MPGQETEQINELIGQFDIAMLVTWSLEGALRARPMAIAEHAGAGELYFATRAGDAKLTEIRNSDDIAIVMQADGVFLSISGTAQIVKSSLLADELWSKSMRLWFPDGPSDPDLAVIHVLPTYAEYWDRTGARRLEFLWEAGKALLQSRTVPDDELSGHDKLRLAGGSG